MSLVVGVVLAVAGVVVFAAHAVTHRPAAGRSTSTTRSGSGAGSGADGARSLHGITAVSAGIGLRAGAVSPNASGIAAARAALPKLDAYQLAGQRVIYSYSGLTPPASLLWAIRHGRVAGVIFFSENVGSSAHIKAVAKELQAANASPANPVRAPLLLMTDQEGGVVRRLSGPPVPSAKQIGASAHPQQEATKQGAAAGAFMHGLGINVNLAPVLDVYRTPGNFIDQYGRSFSNNPAKVAKLGSLFATAMQGKGVAATVKHFPGLGAAARSQNTDERPVTLNLTLSQIRSTDELPYSSAVTAKVKLAMVSWAIYPALDKKFPAGLSSTIVQGELRKRLGFAGVTITDALEAGALKNFGGTSNRATLAAKAGMDLVLCASRNYTQGVTAMKALRAYYLSASASGQASFKAAAERVIALRASLAG
ncbi:MAG TPA: glycoside hydrolase family 3 N-terminal domain-containing protein [Streptosporangiaceae bacterium]